MPLSFSALMRNTEDVEMEDAFPVLNTDPSAVDVAMTFDFDFELDELDKNSTATQYSQQEESDDLELRSPRTPTFKVESALDSHAPFDADRYFKFPILALSHEHSSLTALSLSPAARSHFDLITLSPISKEPQRPTTPPPPSPIPWIWTCHLCHSRYHLGATRRCLVDGHYYCSGDNSSSAQRNIKKRKRGQSCSSEFDYVGWQNWNLWKADVLGKRQRALAGAATTNTGPVLRGCEGCDYPSHCRYKKLNKVPEVVALVTQNAGKVEKSENVAKAKEGTRQKKRSLVIDMAPIASRTASKDKSRGGVLKTLSPIPEADGPMEKSDDSSAVQASFDAQEADQSTPVSPDLADLSSVGLGNALVGDTDEVNSKAGGGGVSDSFRQAAANMGLPMLRRVKSRPKEQPGEKSITKQYRKSNFFEIT